MINICKKTDLLRNIISLRYDIKDNRIKEKVFWLKSKKRDRKEIEKTTTKNNKKIKNNIDLESKKTSIHNTQITNKKFWNINVNINRKKWKEYNWKYLYK